MTQNLEERIKNIARVLGKGKERQNGHNWLTCCPVHDDKNPSFSIGLSAEGKLLYKCFAGCSAQQIMEALIGLGLLEDYRRKSPDMKQGEGIRKVILGDRTNKAPSVVALGVGGEPNATISEQTLSEQDLHVVALPAFTPQLGHNDATMESEGKEKSTKDKALDLWEKAIPIEGTLGEAYLNNRGISLEQLKNRNDLNDLLRFDSTQQALTSQIQDAKGNIQGIQRIFLKEGGQKIEGKAKKTMGHLKGNIVLLPASGKKLILTEGVEDALTLAVCCPSYSVGAFLGGNIDLTIGDQFKEIIIAADNDETGKKMAIKLKRKLQRQGKAVGAAYPTFGKDFNEWWQAKGDKDGICHTIGNATIEVSGFLKNKTDASDIFPYKSKKQEFWVHHLLPKTGVVLLSGHPKTGKSWLTLNFIADILFGKPALGSFETKRTGIYLLSLEDGTANLKERFLMVSAGQMPEKGTLYFKNVAEGFDGGGLESLKREIEEDGHIKLLVIDPYEKVRASSNTSNQNAYSKDYTDISALTSLADELEICIVLVHHFKKQTTGDVTTDQNGSQALSGAVDVLMGLYRDRENDEHTLTVTGRCLPEQTIKLDFDETTGRYQVNEDLAVEEKNLKSKIVDLFKMNMLKSFTPKEIAEEVNYLNSDDQSIVRRSIKGLLNDKILKKIKRGYYQYNADCGVRCGVNRGNATTANPQKIMEERLNCGVDYTPTLQRHNGSNQEFPPFSSVLPEGYSQMEI